MAVAAAAASVRILTINGEAPSTDPENPQILPGEGTWVVAGMARANPGTVVDVLTYEIGTALPVDITKDSLPFWNFDLALQNNDITSLIVSALDNDAPPSGSTTAPVYVQRNPGIGA